MILKNKLFWAFILAVLFRSFVLFNLYPITLVHPQIMHLPFWLTLILGLGNFCLLFLIGKRMFGTREANIASLIYAISPWFVYLEIVGSFYILVLFTGLLLFYLMDYFGLDKRLMFLFLALVVFLGRDEIGIFSNIGLINTVNMFRGEALGSSIGFLSKLFENKYLYLSEHFIFTFLSSIWPTNFFTPDIGLLSNSYQPLFLTGLIIPFFIGLEEMIKKVSGRITYICLFLLSFIPAVLSSSSPDTERLLVVSPYLIFMICLGIIKMENLKKKRYMKFLYYGFIALVVIQSLVMVSDIYLREPIRLYQLRYPV